MANRPIRGVAYTWSCFPPRKGLQPRTWEKAEKGPGFTGTQAGRICQTVSLPHWSGERSFNRTPFPSPTYTPHGGSERKVWDLLLEYISNSYLLELSKLDWQALALSYSPSLFQLSLSITARSTFTPWKMGKSGQLVAQVCGYNTSELLCDKVAWTKKATLVISCLSASRNALSPTHTLTTMEQNKSSWEFVNNNMVMEPAPWILLPSIKLGDTQDSLYSCWLAHQMLGVSFLCKMRRKQIGKFCKTRTEMTDF